MNFFDLVDISERTIEILNPLTPEKILTIGAFLRLEQGNLVIDFGCGYAEPLALWAEHFGITGIGIDVRERACARARAKLAGRGLAGRVEIIHAPGEEYVFEPGAFDAAVCLGASFIWNGFAPTLRAMRPAIRSTGRLAVGEPHWLSDAVPPEYAKMEASVLTEHRILEVIREEGFALEYLVRSSQDDWDRYEAANWHGLIRWLEENPEHPDRDTVIQHLRKIQDEYLTFGRQHLGWAVYVLAPASY